MSEQQPAHATPTAPLPLGMRILLGIFYLHLAAGCALFIPLLILLGDHPSSSDLQFIFLGTMFPLAPLIFFCLRAILAVHARHPEAPRRCIHVLNLNLFFLALLAIAFCWIMIVSGHSTRRDMMQFLSIAILPLMANFLALWISWRYLHDSPLVKAAFGTGARDPATAAHQGTGDGPTEPLPTGPQAAVPAGIHLFTAACIFALIRNGYYLQRYIMWLLDEAVSSAILPSLVQNIVQLLLLITLLFARFKRPVRPLPLIQFCLGGFMALQGYSLIRLFLRLGFAAVENSAFLWICGYGLSAGAFLLYFKTSALARAFLATPPKREHRTEHSS